MSLLAQVNVSRLRHAAEDPRSRGFFAALDEINLLADRAPGFVWRHQDAEGHLDGAVLLGDPLTVVNLSLWRSYSALHDYVYRSPHGRFVRRRAEWFVPIAQPSTALWWVPDAVRPTPEQAVQRLYRLRRSGPAPQAFTMRRRFDADGHRER